MTNMNPLIIKGFRERLRVKQLIAWGLFALIVTSFAYMTSYLEGRDQSGYYDHELEEWSQGEPSPINGARAAFPILLGIQGFILLFLGTGRVASGTAEEREVGLLDYQRMTPMNPFSKIVGYLFGLPAREYFMFGITLPFLLHAVIVGEISPGKTVHLYTVFFSCVLLYHLTAHVTGLVVSKPRAASWVSRMVVLGLYVVLPGLGQAGFSFLSFLTLLPTYFGLMKEELKPVNKPEYGFDFWQDSREFWQEVPFFDLTLSPSLFTVLMQGLLLAALLTTAYRKWRNENLPAFSKTFGIGFFAVLQFLLLGCLWQLYGEGEASGLLGSFFSQKDFKQEFPRHESGFTLVFVQTILFTLSLATAVLIIHVTCPTRHQYIKGKRRAAKLDLPTVPLLADEKPGAIVILCLAILMPVTHFMLLMRAADSNMYFNQFPELETFALPCILFAACLVYLRAARERWFNVGFWGFLGLLWITPPLACMVLAVGWEEDAMATIFHLGSLSPPFAFFEVAGRPHHMNLDEYERAFRQAAIFGVLFASILAAVLSIGQTFNRRNWDKREKSIAAERES